MIECKKQSQSWNERVFVDMDLALRLIGIRPGWLKGAQPRALEACVCLRVWLCTQVWAQI